ncbi:alpha/beta fold hydrolase [Noviherbaspirillum malthae]|uniref:alpha/beta fold hydrolase n=1 Tax=Noviherbaspirillum malthae TaxID=1260987 RepID=UPI001E5C391D|nr:alpha/beta hydrolase [Noviherbaspirillum malthae]
MVWRIRWSRRVSSWVFLRGLIRESRHWGDFPSAFQRRFSDAQIFTPDLPGNGVLNDMPSPLTIDAMVDHARTWLAAREHRRPVYLLGLSMGGMLAVRLAQRYPAELAGCVLINSSLRNFSPFYHRLQWRSYGTLLRILMSRNDAVASEQLVWEMTSSRRPIEPEILRQWIACRRARPVSMINAVRKVIAASRCRAGDRAPKVPLLVLALDHDRLVSPNCSRRIAEAWNARLCMHPHAGHDLALDDGEWIAETTGNWVEGLGNDNFLIEVGVPTNYP